MKDIPFFFFLILFFESFIRISNSTLRKLTDPNAGPNQEPTPEPTSIITDTISTSIDSSSPDISSSDTSTINMDISSSNLDATNSENIDTTDILPSTILDTSSDIPDITTTSLDTEKASSGLTDLTSSLTTEPTIEITSLLTEINSVTETDEITSSSVESLNSTSSSDNYVSTDITTNLNDTNEVSYIINDTVRTRVLLIGFGGYKRSTRSIVLLKVYFLRIEGKFKSTLYLFFKVKINYNRILRSLEPESEEEANCIRLSEENDDKMEYNCSINVDGNKEISQMKAVENSFQIGNKTYRESTDAFFSSYANSTFEQLNFLGADPFEKLEILSDGILQENSNSFTIIGEIKNLTDYNQKEVILSLDPNGNGDLKNVTCSIKKLENIKYQLDCYPKTSIKGRLDGVNGKTNEGRTLLIHKANNTDDYVDILITNPVKASKNSSGGLSGGAIAGIVLACCAALIAAGLAIYFCNTKKPVKPPVNASEMEMYNSSVTHT